MTNMNKTKIDRETLVQAVDHFINIYGVRENATATEKIERLEQLAKDRNTPKSDKEEIKKLLKLIIFKIRTKKQEILNYELTETQ